MFNVSPCEGDAEFGHVVRELDDNTSIIMFNLLGYDRDSISVRIRQVDEEKLHVIEVRTDQVARPSSTMIAKSRFGEMIDFKAKTLGEPVVVAFADVYAEHEVVAEADWVDGALVVLVKQVVSEPKEKEIAFTCAGRNECATKECERPNTASEMLHEMLKKASEKKPAKQEENESPFTWKQSYWLNGKDVDKETFEKKVGKSADEWFKQFDFDSFDSMFDVFKKFD